MRPSLLLIFLVPFAAQAETIQLKTGGHINLSAFDCTPVTESQLLHRVCYNEAHHYLIAKIGSEYYDNCNVSPKAVDGLMDSSHVVSDYNQHIRAGHECNSDLRRRIGVAILGALEH